MNNYIIKQVVKLLRQTAETIESGNCEMTEDEAMDIMSVLSHHAMSKEEASIYMNMSPSKFDNLVREGKVPRGRKRRGFKELRWYEDELNPKLRKRK